MWCSRCQNAWYCSAEHLQSVHFQTFPTLLGLTRNIPLQDWSRHKHECNPVIAAGQQPYTLAAAPAPPQQQIITVAGLLFAPMEGQLIVASRFF